MGIINLTPDSFYSGSRREQVDDVVNTARQMLAAGADILDLGGMSSRPGAEVIDVSTELARILPPLEALLKHFPKAIVSIDTVRSEVARRAVQAGAAIVNDISAGTIDPQMYQTVAELGVPYVLMHMPGTPASMQKQVNYEDVVQEILDFFIREVARLRQLGIKDIVIDPGFGFGKTVRQNYELLQNLSLFQILEVPVLAGLSRKSMIYKLLETDAAGALNGTTAVHLIALQQGAQLLRVHDVREAREVIKVWQTLEDTKNQQQ